MLFRSSQTAPSEPPEPPHQAGCRPHPVAHPASGLGGKRLVTAEPATGLRGLVERLHLRTTLERAARFSTARLAVAVFALIIVVVATLLSLPFASADDASPSFVDALFTATSAVCVTGLTVVDTATYWSTFGQLVIIVGAAIGGLGVMTLASLLSLAVSRHVGLTQRMMAATENQSRLGDEIGRAHV